ncbi:hypothetical protein [Oceanobacillus jeddahense]|uniref:Uncharacterized protein n=1 Tax=Oceanobacillus jeddahense TaxID=1462527 RepID=A0ABY5JNN8_9BACI|nr:hypothetical protein [Oceanobacillus jeddahense]UUI01920.1 hypothetical protein NP439_17980 [Oceanobacillus jeddahense]
MMPFLYFPEDKMEYIPAAISLLIFIALAVVVMRWVMKKSKKDQERFEQEYHDVLKQTQKNNNVTNTSSNQ